jgi:integrase
LRHTQLIVAKAQLKVHTLNMIMRELTILMLSQMNIRERTSENYQGALDRYILPILGNKSIKRLNRFEFAKALSILPPQSRYQTLMALRSIFRSAVDQGLIKESPIEGIKTPKIKVAPTKFMTWDYMKEHHFGPYDDQIRFLALHGLRWGEAIVLTESDIKDGMVVINKSIHGLTKSVTSNRSVPYLGYFKPFPKSRHALNRYLDKHDVNIHSLRKTYAYILKRNGIHVTTAQKLMGHASPMVTMRIYTAVLSEEVVEAGETLKEKLKLDF